MPSIQLLSINARNALRYVRGIPGVIMRDRERVSRLSESKSEQLVKYEKQYFSQHGEDGILQEIFSRIRRTNSFFVEFGVEDGIQSNTAYLARMQQWNGVLFEADPESFAAAVKNYHAFPAVRIGREFITAENINDLFTQYDVPKEPDLVSIDIDGNDYWVWKSLSEFRPRVIVIEYNAAYPPPVRLAMRYNPDHRWNRTTAYGASLSALAQLGDALGYKLIGTEKCGVNAFFVRGDLLSTSGFDQLSPDVAFHAPNYSRFHPTHPYGAGDFVEFPKDAIQTESL